MEAAIAANPANLAVRAYPVDLAALNLEPDDGATWGEAASAVLKRAHRAP